MTTIKYALVEARVLRYDEYYRPYLVSTKEVSIAVDLLKEAKRTAMERAPQKGFSGFYCSPEGNAVFIKNGNGDFGTTVTLSENPYSGNNFFSEELLPFDMPEC